MWLPYVFQVGTCGYHMATIWLPCVFHVSAILMLSGYCMYSILLPYRFHLVTIWLTHHNHMDSMRFLVHMVSIWLPCGSHMGPIWSTCGNAWFALPGYHVVTVIKQAMWKPGTCDPGIFFMESAWISYGYHVEIVWIIYGNHNANNHVIVIWKPCR